MGTGHADEADTWARARDGDSSAFAALFDRHRDRVFGQALRLTRSPHDAEDVTAMVFLEAWRRRTSVRVVDGSIVAWLLVTTNFVVRNHARSVRRYRAALERIPKPAVSDRPDETEAVDHRLDTSDRDAAVRAAFGELSGHDQDVITLCLLEELPMEQAAATLKVPVGTVKSRLSRARRRLAALLTAALGPEASDALPGVATDAVVGAAAAAAPTARASTAGGPSAGGPSAGTSSPGTASAGAPAEGATPWGPAAEASGADAATPSADPPSNPAGGAER